MLFELFPFHFLTKTSNSGLLKCYLYRSKMPSALQEFINSKFYEVLLSHHHLLYVTLSITNIACSFEPII